MAIEFYNEIDLDKLPKPSEGVDEETLQRIADLEELVKAQATTITNQAIAINKQSELINIVDTDLNGLVGDVSE